MIENIEKLDIYLNEIKAFYSKEQGKKEKLLEQIEQNEESISKIQEDVELIDKVGDTSSKYFRIR